MSGKHAIPAAGNERALWMALGLTSIFLVKAGLSGATGMLAALAVSSRS